MYDALIIDVLNLAYKTFANSEEKLLARLNSKTVQIHSVKVFIDQIKAFETRFLKKNGNVFLLFDNPTSRDELKELFVPLSPTLNRKAVDKNYKSNRVAKSPAFYSSVDFIKYYYMINDSHYKSARIHNLEADDLVKPCLDYVQNLSGKEAMSLLISDDSDWCRYASAYTHYLPNPHGEPKTNETFFLEKGFEVTEEKIILEKILMGDSADNIKAVYPEMPIVIRIMALKDFESIQDLISRVEEKDYLDAWKQTILSRIAEAKAAYQMLATIPVSADQFKYNCVIGRNSKVLQEAVESTLKKALQEKERFEFTSLKIPRVNPKEQK